MISQERNGRTYTYLYDGHGSVVGLMSEDGSVTDTYTYDAFGNLLKSTGRTQNNYRYCGEQFDSTTGLYYLRARYMDTSTGRFISQDSYAGSVYDPVSLHKYLYANSNPVTYSDPSGYNSVAIRPGTAIDMWAQMEAAAASAAMAVWNWFLSLLPTIMVAATGFSAILFDNPAFLDVCEQFVSGNMSIYDLQQQIIETFQKIDQSVRDYIYEARNGGSSNNSSGGSSNNGGMSQGDPNNWNWRDKLLDKAQNSKLKNIIDQLYRKTAHTGDGGTADMLRQEVANGEPLKHLQKAQDKIIEIQRLLTNEQLSESDRKLAYQLLNDLYDAVKTANGVSLP